MKMILRESMHSKFSKNNLGRFVSTRHPSLLKPAFNSSVKPNVFYQYLRKPTFKYIPWTVNQRNTD